MPQIYADTNMQTGSDVCHVVYCWDQTKTRRKIFKSYGTDKKQAEIDLSALRSHHIDAELVTVGA